MLRINSDGTIPTDNPFYNTATGVKRPSGHSACEIRLPSRFQPGTGRMFINDVGQRAWEEINDGIAGSNYGWPSQEGITGDPNFRDPLFAYPHTRARPAALRLPAVGCQSAGQGLPADYAGEYFFGEKVNNWIGRYDPSTDSVTVFAPRHVRRTGRRGQSTPVASVL